ncbi:MAG: phycobilisome protein [Synechococcales cyanobacterium C42_A2020_086]|jgi:hypothetical protein|nr:phycobilisome protein [Synechococcales cyanobacterium C42_A2020_086]
MLSQFEHLRRETDGRYASDAELEFAIDYVRSFNLRVQTYLKLQEIEAALVQQTYLQMRALNPAWFVHGNTDVSAKWKRDTIRVLRYVAVAVLTHDPDTFRERMLLWFQTIMRAFGAQQSCSMTYQVLQDIIRQHLTAPQAELVCPLLEMSRRAFGAAS